MIFSAPFLLRVRWRTTAIAVRRRRTAWARPPPPLTSRRSTRTWRLTGQGLPPGNGDAAKGATLYAAQCASCHGAKGEGAPGNPPGPALVGREPREGFDFGNDPKLVRTVGNYWPEATTLFDYIKRTMPLSAPGSLSDTTCTA